MKPTPPLQKALRRLALTTKQGPHNYYKGNRTGSQGSINKYGIFSPDREKIRTYVCPDLRDFTLTPFVSNRVDKDSVKESYVQQMDARGHPLDGEAYLRRWKGVVGHVEHGDRESAERKRSWLEEPAVEEAEKGGDERLVRREHGGESVRAGQEGMAAEKEVETEKEKEKGRSGLFGWLRR